MITEDDLEKECLNWFRELVFTGQYFEVLIFDSSDTIRRSWSNY